MVLAQPYNTQALAQHTDPREASVLILIYIKFNMVVENRTGRQLEVALYSLWMPSEAATPRLTSGP